jgi:hypothetical protein
MLKIKVTEKSGASCTYQSKVALDYSALGHGKPELWIPASQPHDAADVIATEAREVSPAMAAVIDANGNEVSPAVPAVLENWVKLRAEYTVEIEDITAEFQLAEVLAKRKAEYPTVEEFMDAWFDGGQQGLNQLKAKREAVKAKYQKK